MRLTFWGADDTRDETVRLQRGEDDGLLENSTQGVMPVTSVCPFPMSARTMAPNHQAALGVPIPLRPGPRTGVNQRRGSRGRGQLTRRLRHITVRSTLVKQILAIAGIAVGLASSAAWTAFLGYELFRVIKLMI